MKSPSEGTLTYIKPVSAGASRDSCYTQWHGKIDNAFPASSLQTFFKPSSLYSHLNLPFRTNEVSLSFRLLQLASNWMPFHEISYWEFLQPLPTRKLNFVHNVKKQINRHVTRICKYNTISCSIFLWLRKSINGAKEIKKAYFTWNKFLCEKSRSLRDSFNIHYTILRGQRNSWRPKRKYGAM
jgi:hypothetical protein